jgi:hypothetical protein
VAPTVGWTVAASTLRSQGWTVGARTIGDECVPKANFKAVLGRRTAGKVRAFLLGRGERRAGL